MPKIKVYKGKGAIIPVDEAKLSTGFRCPFTDGLYATKKSYVQHLARLRKNRMHTNARNRLWERKRTDMFSQTSITDIVNWIETNPDFFWANGIRHNGWTSRNNAWEKIRDNFGIKILLIDLTWSGRVSNTHSCPLNGVTNWSGVDDRPRGYPGWIGKIKFKMTTETPGFMSDIFKGTGINTGTGGGHGNGVYGYELKLFADDWVGLDKVNLLYSLKNNKNLNFFYVG